MGDFMKQYLKVSRSSGPKTRKAYIANKIQIQKDIAEAPDDDKGMEESRVADAVDALIDLYQDEGRTDYQLALLCIQITWWADPVIHADIEEYGEEVFTLCQNMRDAEPEAARGGVLAEVLEYLQSEAKEALAYVREQADRVRRRPRAMKWHHYIQDDVRRPRVVPMSRRIALKREQEFEGMDTGDDVDRGDNSEDDMQEEDEEDDGMEMDDLDGDEKSQYYDEEEEELESPFNKYPVGGTDRHGDVRQLTTAKDKGHAATPTKGSESGTDGKADPAIRKESRS